MKKHGGTRCAGWNNVAGSYDRYRGLAQSVIKYAGESDAIDYTEVQCALPVTQISRNGDDSDPTIKQEIMFMQQVLVNY